MARAGLSGVSAGAACQCQSRCPPGHRDWLPSRTCHWQSRWAATSGSESGASGRHRSSLLRMCKFATHMPLSLITGQPPRGCVSMCGTGTCGTAGACSVKRTAPCQCALSLGESGDFRHDPCVPRFKFALRGAFASTADRAQTDQKRDGLLGSVRIYMGQPRCGFVFKLQFSSLVLVVEN